MGRLGIAAEMERLGIKVKHSLWWVEGVLQGL